LDEALDVLAGLWSGKPFSYEGEHYKISETTLSPSPVQRLRVPVWVAGVFPSKPPLRRAARWDCIIPGQMRELTPSEVRTMLSYTMKNRTCDAPFDYAFLGRRDDPGPNGERGPEKVALYAEARITWWLE
jgi:hypothetical protein